MIADQSILFTLSYCLTIIIGIIGLYMIYPKAVLIAVLAVPFKELLCIRMSKLNEASISKFMGVLQEFSAQFGDSVRGIREVKLWNLQSQKRKKLLRYQDDVLQERKNFILYSCYQNVFGSLIDKIPICILYAYGGYLFVTGEVTIGGVSAFIAYTGNILNSIGAILSVRFLFSNIKPAITRLNTFLTAEEENTAADRIDIGPVSIKSETDTIKAFVSCSCPAIQCACSDIYETRIVASASLRGLNASTQNYSSSL